MAVVKVALTFPAFGQFPTKWLVTNLRRKTNAMGTIFNGNSKIFMNLLRTYHTSILFLAPFFWIKILPNKTSAGHDNISSIL